MKNPKIGPMIRKAREKLDLTREQFGRRLKISASYVGHLERSAPVHFSEDLLIRMIEKVGVPKRLLYLRTAHNKRATAWYRNYRKRVAKKAA